MKNGKQVSLLRVGTVLLALLILLAAACLVSMAVGSAGYSVPEILRALFSEEKSAIKTIVINLRLPRIILAILIGASLAAAGALLQSVMRNPLADPAPSASRPAPAPLPPPSSSSSRTSPRRCRSSPSGARLWPAC